MPRGHLIGLRRAIDGRAGKERECQKARVPREKGVVGTLACCRNSLFTSVLQLENERECQSANGCWSILIPETDSPGRPRQVAERGFRRDEEIRAASWLTS